MAFDLVVKDGMIVDGSGLPRYRADIGVKDGKIAEIGRINGAAAKETLNAEGRVTCRRASPTARPTLGRISRDPIGASSASGRDLCGHGHSGFTLALCRWKEADLRCAN